MAYARREPDDDLRQANRRMLETSEQSDVVFKVKSPEMGSSPAKPQPKPEPVSKSTKPNAEPIPVQRSITPVPVDNVSQGPSRRKSTTDSVIHLNDSEGQLSVKAHSFVLHSQCRALDDMLQNAPVVDGKKVIELPDVNADAFKVFLGYLYYREADLSKANAFDVLRLAIKCEKKSLDDICVNYIRRSINPSTVCDILRQSLDLEHEGLKYTSLAFIQRNTKAVLSDPSFLKADERVVNTIAEQDYLDILEIELLKRCVAWARAKPNQPDGEMGQQKAINGEDLRTTMGSNLISNIRFPTMSVTDFNQVVVPLKILTNDEVVEIYNYITAPNTNKPKTDFNKIPRHAGKPYDTARTERPSDMVTQRDYRRVERMETPIIFGRKERQDRQDFRTRQNELPSQRDYKRMETPDSMSSDVYRKVFFS